MTLGILRDWMLVLGVAAAGFGYDHNRRGATGGAGTAGDHSAVAVETGSDAQSVILVVSDGLRWQEVFRGADSTLLFSKRGFFRRSPPAAAAQRYWRPTPAERRSALMPFLWSTVAREGQLVGNRDAGSRMRVSNGLNFSYPGYSEMLVGFPDPEIDSNNHGPNRNVTVFEWLNRRSDYRGRVGAVGAWSAFEDIFNQRRSGLRMHASRREPLDVRSHAAAMRMLKEQGTRALFVAYVETDDHAHDGRYDRVLDAAHAVDAYLAELWSTVQADPRYAGRTTLIVTADHGRGRTIRDWTSHGRRVPGSDETFLAIIGPAVPARGVRGDVTAITAQVAATVAAAVGLEFRGDGRAAAGMIPAAVVR